MGTGIGTLSLSFILAIGSKNTGKCEKDGFSFIFQSTFPREEGEGGGLRSLPAFRTFGQQLSLQCWVSPPRDIRAGYRDSSNQQEWAALQG